MSLERAVVLKIQSLGDLWGHRNISLPSGNPNILGHSIVWGAYQRWICRIHFIVRFLLLLYLGLSRMALIQDSSDAGTSLISPFLPSLPPPLPSNVDPILIADTVTSHNKQYHLLQRVFIILFLMSHGFRTHLNGVNLFI
jgi:hypothetical protein